MAARASTLRLWTALALAGSLATGASACSGAEADGPAAEPPTDAKIDGSVPYDEREQAPLALVDLSILFPLPDETDGLWRADDTGPLGKLLPDTFELPAIALPDAYPDRASERAALRVVALRLDPCFQEGGPGAPCQPQIRLVLQPLEIGGSRPRFADAAFHAFYTTTDATVRDLAEQLRRARIDSRISIDRAVLGEHPVLRAQGPDGPFARTLRERVFAHVGAASLERLTVMALAGRNNTWSFTSLSVRSGTLQPMELRHLPPGTELQHLVSSGMGGHLELAVTPSSTAADTLEPGYRAGVTLDAPTAQALYPRVLRIENPRTHDNGTIDCVSCHVAAGVRRFLEAQPHPLDSTQSYTASEPLRTDDEAFVDTSVVHMFSYRGRVALVSPRVAHETSRTLELLDRTE